MQPFKAVGVRADFLESQNHVMRGAAPFFMGGGSLGSWLYQAYGAPWLKDDPNQRLKTITESEYSALVTAERNGGAITRWNGSPLFPAKIPDVIGLKDRKYFDHTATHLHRDIGDLMRYAAQVTVAELKGVWYRGHYLHDGSVASLEEMFDPDRLRDSHMPGGYSTL
jgi:hypothetical protein